MKAIGLLSGGLDSELAIKLISDQGIEVQGLHFTHTFCTPVCTPIKPNIIKVTQELGIALEIIDINEAIMNAIGMPCIAFGIFESSNLSLIPDIKNKANVNPIPALIPKTKDCIKL